MTANLYAIQDKLNGYMSPVAFQTEDQAKRWFREQTMLTQAIAITPEDFSLWQIGTYDTDTAEIKNNEPKLCKMIMRGEKPNV